MLLWIMGCTILLFLSYSSFIPLIAMRSLTWPITWSITWFINWTNTWFITRTATWSLTWSISQQCDLILNTDRKLQPGEPFPPTTSPSHPEDCNPNRVVAMESKWTVVGATVEQHIIIINIL
jgi:hypothetical protein